MKELPRKIQFYRSCFEADNRALQLNSVYSAKAGHLRLLNDADLLTGKVVAYHATAEWAAPCLKTLNLYSKERELYCGALFVLGAVRVLNKKQKLIAPLLLYPAGLRKKGKEDYFVEVDLQRPRLNPAAISNLQAINPELNALDQLYRELKGGPLRFQEVVWLREQLAGLFSNLDQQLAEEYPRVATAEQFDRIRKNSGFFADDGQFHLVSAACLMVLEKNRSGRGILNEL
ncbi:MAG: hypothetical protein KDC44_21470, partial [Phaeodactylibacter sp.]|nr:hypothetical protein [Phaeodactylibacter sp.]